MKNCFFDANPFIREAMQKYSQKMGYVWLWRLFVVNLTLLVANL